MLALACPKPYPERRILGADIRVSCSTHTFKGLQKMPQEDRYGQYRLNKLITENSQIQTWLATDTRTGDECVAKVLTCTVDESQNAVRTILLQSIQFQKLIWHRGIVTSIGKYVRRERVLVAYPLINTTLWKPVTPALFWKHVSSILLEMGILLDYLHWLGLVHGDVKLSHFLFNTEYSTCRMKLIDLDFMTMSNSSPSARLFGTPGYIAPEILNNDIVTEHSDNYSLGICLKECVKATEEHSTEFVSNLSKVKDLADVLTEEDRYRRPRILLNALYDHKLITCQDHKAALQRLLTMTWIACWRNSRLPEPITPIRLSEHLARKARTVGIPLDVVEDLYQVWRRQPVSGLLLIRHLVRSASIERIGDYFQLAVPDMVAKHIFEVACKVEGHNTWRSGSLDSSTVDARTALLDQAKFFKRKGQYLKSFIYLNNVLSLAEKCPGTEELRQLLLELGFLARVLNRPQEATEFLTKAASIESSSSDRRLSVLHDLAQVLINDRNLKQAKSIVDTGLRESIALKDNEFRLRFGEQRAWSAAASGHLALAEKDYASLISEAEDFGFNHLLIRLYNGMGIAAWRSGNFLHSRDLLRKCIDIAKRQKLLSEAVSGLRNLSVLCFELGNYTSAVKYGKLALKSSTNPLDLGKVPHICYAVAAAYVRLSEFGKAEYWYQQSISKISGTNHNLLLCDYYQLMGWLNLNRSQILTGKQLLHRALETAGDTQPNRTEAKAYHSLAEIFLLEGEYDSCMRALQKARAVLESLGEEAACIELDFLGALNSSLNHDPESVPELYNNLDLLIHHNCHYYATVCLFYVLMLGTKELVRKAIKEGNALHELVSARQTPLAGAVSQLLSWHLSVDSSMEQRVATLKQIYQDLVSSGQTLPALLVCEKIAMVYAAELQLKLACRFYSQAAKLAVSLGNKRLQRAMSAKAEAVPADSTGQERLLRSIHGISEILKNRTSYEDTLRSILQYVVSETGAERGVILMRSDPKSQLQVRASLHCDNTSLEDVVDISQSLPLDAATSRSPLVIENALTDERTRGYKSVVVHNILSVICIPITIMDRCLGVIYLDHHTIPALFDKPDITFVSSVGNFISTALESIHELRQVSSTADRLQQELAEVGIGSKFVTESPLVRDLLSRFPSIARTNVSVLLVGESGTGKEILCEMLHSMSLRSQGPLVKLNCAAVPNTIIESELFGIAKNVATGVGQREGKFAAADGGTLLLDEIADMPLEIQAKVLRVLEYQQFEKVGSNRTIHTDVRFIYATNKDLQELIHKGKFRQDLFYRINTMIIRVPPLRERCEDVIPLLEHFLKSFSPEQDLRPRFSKRAIEVMLTYEWPGNVRQLRNLAEKACILWPGRVVEKSDLPEEFQETRDRKKGAGQISNAIEKSRITEALIANKWNQSQTARVLDMPLTTLRRKISQYDIRRQ